MNVCCKGNRDKQHTEHNKLDKDKICKRKLVAKICFCKMIYAEHVYLSLPQNVKQQ